MKKDIVAGIVLAAGSGKRMMANKPKQYLMLEGKPVLYYTLKAFESSAVDTVILVVGANEVEYVKNDIIDRYKIKKVDFIVKGGKERYHSVWQGLKAASKSDYVLIHDGARPFITKEIIEEVMHKVKECKACVVGVPVKDTIKVVNSNNCIINTPDRSSLWSIQTPQAFSTELITRAYDIIIKKEKKTENTTCSNGYNNRSQADIEKDLKREQSETMNITDDAMVLEYTLNHPVQMISGSYRNIKITTPEDLVVGKAFLREP